MSIEQLFQLQKRLPKWRQSFIKMVLKTRFFVKSSNFHVVWTIQFVPISPACGPNTYQIMYGEILDLATVAGKSFKGKFTAKIDFSIGYFILPVLMPTLEV